ncbi:MAG: glutamate synthase-related protein [Gaiellaceae bacterium]
MPTRTLHQLGAERDACGIGFVADVKGRPSREILDLLLAGLAAVKHRGATNADGRTSDGAGVLLPLAPAMLAAPRAGLAMLFLYDETARGAIERACLAEGIEPAGWREVPVDDCQLGDRARKTQPAIVQLHLLRPPEIEDQEAEMRAYRARKRIERELLDKVYVASLSFRTVTYKGLVAADQLGHFYLDLQNPEIEIPFGIFHQRFATNTTPTWERAQPFRFLCHNGEINAVRGNVNWMRAREHRLGSFDDAALVPLIEDPEADSRTLDNALELLVRGERDVRHALSMLIPEAWEGNPELDEEVRDFYRYHACLVEPWDGPAGVIFTDGHIVGAALDRNGLRPLRTAIRSDGIVVCASEAGILEIPDGVTAKRGKLGPGQMIAVDPENGGFLESDYIKKRLARYLPYGRWLEENLVAGSIGEPCEAPADDLLRRQVAFGLTREELSIVMRAIGSSGHEPTSSMGDDSAIAPLANRARLLPGFFKQRFAQVSNPAIDHLRERVIFSLRTLLGERAPILTEGPEAAKLIELESFFLFPSALDELGAVRLDATFDGQEGLRGACERLGSEATALAEQGSALLLVSDTGISAERAAVPSLLAVGTIHQRLVAAGLRTRASILVESNEARETHHFATLLGFGADAICPRLALETMAAYAAADKVGGDHPDSATAQLRYRTAIEDGILKIMSKMGISDVASYRGAQIFEGIGLAQEIMDLAFTRTPSPLGGIGFAELEQDAWARVRNAFGDDPKLANPGYVKWRKGAEEHATSVPVVDAMHELAEKAGAEGAALLAQVDEADREAVYELRKAIGGDGWESYERFARLVNERVPLEVRDLLELVPAGEPVPLDEVEPVESIVRRFSGGAMSHGALSSEAHETIAVALNMIGARANSGEGGEDPSRYHTNRASLIKQVASGRFGVTPAYLRAANELQIKIAQGSKPGEGGQLPGHKVSAEIARLRHTEPGVALISPPPHHDIYSIEDLAQLIFDLRQVHPQADVSVKLVSEQGVGIVAAGVVKALADVVHIAGCDGGTGASPLSSIKNAGAPWELGLAETQQALVSEGLRGRARVRVDGGFKTGRDVIVAALLGADEYAFGTALLLAEGCLMVRSCHLDTCPVGIASQRRDLRDRFAGTPEKVATYVLFVAEEVRRILAALGLRTLGEAIGRTELLRQRKTGNARVDLLDLAPLLAQAGEGPTRHVDEPRLTASGGELGRQLALEAAAMVDSEARVELAYDISVLDRTVGAMLGGDIGERHGLGSPPGQARVRFRGSAGQSFGAFLSDGILFELEGEANDYVGKGMHGGVIAIRPPENDLGDPHLVGNTVLYGATGGELYVAGKAGERYAVRNSGAISVVEGTGDHPCEYMTAGTVVVLGPYGRNLGAGMSGGQIFVYDPDELLGFRLNDDLVRAARLDEIEAASLHDLLTRHQGLTRSPRARELLEDWPNVVKAFWRVRPKAEVARLEEEHEGTVTHAPD